MKDHKVITMEDILAGKVNVKKEEENRYCKEHGKLCEYYCETEERVLCRDCVILNKCAADHTRVSIQEAAQNYTGELRELKRKCDDTLKTFEAAVEATRNVRSELNMQYQTTKDYLAKVEQEYIELMKKRMKELQRTVDQIKQNRERRLDEKQSNLELIIKDFEQAAENTSRVLQSESEYEILSTHAILSTQMQKLSKSKPEAADKCLGFIKFEAAIPVISPVGKLLVSEDGTLEEEWKKMGEFNTGDFTDLLGLDIDRADNIVLCSWEKGARVFTREGKIKCTLYDSPGSVDVAVTKDNKYLSIPIKKCQISSHDCNGQQVNTTTLTSVEGETSNANSLAVDPSGKVIVGQTLNTISIHNTDSSLISKFATSSEPYHLAITSNGDIVGSFLNENEEDGGEGEDDDGVGGGASSQLMDYSGKNVRIIQPPSSEVKIWGPGFVYCRQGEIFVSNEGRGDPTGIFRFTSEGDYLGCVTTDVTNHSGIAMSKDGTELFVADYADSSVKIFQQP